MNIFIEQRRFSLGCPCLYLAGATQTETLLFKQYDAGERVNLLDENNLFWGGGVSSNFVKQALTIEPVEN